MLPLHGRGNKGGEGSGVKVIAYEVPKDPKQKWNYTVIDESMHMTHNLEVVDNGNSELLYIGGKEGVKQFSFEGKRWAPVKGAEWIVTGKSFGEVRAGTMQGKQKVLAGVEPMHGNSLTVYPSGKDTQRSILNEDLNQGHALAVKDLLGTGADQIVVGWREPNKENKVGIKIYVLQDAKGNSWKDFWIDNNGMACEDLQVADLNDDGKKDIIAAGRATHNLKIYWNKSK